MVFNPDDKWDDGEWQVYTNHLQGDGDEKGDLLYHIPLWEGKKSLSYILPRCHFVTQERAIEDGRKKGTQSKPHLLVSLYAMTVVYQYKVPFR
jgi:hypothetical protein